MNTACACVCVWGEYHHVLVLGLLQFLRAGLHGLLGHLGLLLRHALRLQRLLLRLLQLRLPLLLALKLQLGLAVGGLLLGKDDLRVVGTTLSAGTTITAGGATEDAPEHGVAHDLGLEGVEAALELLTLPPLLFDLPGGRVCV